MGWRPMGWLPNRRGDLAAGYDGSAHNDSSAHNAAFLAASADSSS